jgi:hypothetical protein
MPKSGTDADDAVRPEIEHFANCTVCGDLIDMRDLLQVLAHLHGAEIEIGVGDEPPSQSMSLNRFPGAVHNGNFKKDLLQDGPP